MNSLIAWRVEKSADDNILFSHVHFSKATAMKEAKGTPLLKTAGDVIRVYEKHYERDVETGLVKYSIEELIYERGYKKIGRLNCYSERWPNIQKA